MIQLAQQDPFSLLPHLAPSPSQLKKKKASSLQPAETPELVSVRDQRTRDPPINIPFDLPSIRVFRSFAFPATRPHPRKHRPDGNSQKGQSDWQPCRFESVKKAIHAHPDSIRIIGRVVVDALGIGHAAECVKTSIDCMGIEYMYGSRRLCSFLAMFSQLLTKLKSPLPSQSEYLT